MLEVIGLKQTKTVMQLCTFFRNEDLGDDALAEDSICQGPYLGKTIVLEVCPCAV
jgi:hypothetical protein